MYGSQCGSCTLSDSVENKWPGDVTGVSPSLHNSVTLRQSIAVDCASGKGDICLSPIVADRHTDPSVLNPVISQKPRVARFTPTFWQSHDLYDIHLTQKSGFVGAKVFYRQHSIAYSQPQF